MLNQVFIVGTGSIGDSEQRMFHVPASATELWLGFPDAGTFAGHPGNYADNPGIDVVYGTLSSGCDLSSNGGAISSQTLATVPGEPDSRACVGVGESVLLTTASPATWTVTSTSGTVGLTTILQPPTESFPSGKGFPTLECASASGSASIYGTQACFRAPWVFDKIVVTAKFDDGSTASKTFSSLQPTGLIFQRIQWPTKGQDYYFLNTFDAFNVAMTSVVFMTPGYVSFANILVSEHDTANPHLDPNSNVLFNVNQLKAWIISCDRDQDSSRPDMDPINPKTSSWVFVDWKGQNEKEFAHVQTKWTAGQFPLSYYQYSKGQVDAQAADGTFVNTPVYPATSAVLSVWGLPPYHNDWTFPSTQDQCIQEATMLFQPIH
ncbi:MAG TPA: hypothetical protein VFB43_01470 [Terracidiphilus sp.]|nr:hypothetical protein [Terracidiphilus sp.]